MNFKKTKAQLVKNPPAMRETWVQSLGWEDPLGKGKATHSSILARRVPWIVKSTGLQRVGHDGATFTFTFLVLSVSPELPRQYECVTRLKTSLQSYNMLESSINLWVWYLETVCSR